MKVTDSSGGKRKSSIFPPVWIFKLNKTILDCEGGSFLWQWEGWLRSLWNSRPCVGNGQHEQSWDSGWMQIPQQWLSTEPTSSREAEEAIQIIAKPSNILQLARAWKLYWSWCHEVPISCFTCHSESCRFRHTHILSNILLLILWFCSQGEKNLTATSGSEYTVCAYITGSCLCVISWSCCITLLLMEGSSFQGPQQPQ